MGGVNPNAAKSTIFILKIKKSLLRVSAPSSRYLTRECLKLSNAGPFHKSCILWYKLNFCRYYFFRSQMKRNRWKKWHPTLPVRIRSAGSVREIGGFLIFHRAGGSLRNCWGLLPRSRSLLRNWGFWWGAGDKFPIYIFWNIGARNLK